MKIFAKTSHMRFRKDDPIIREIFARIPQHSGLQDAILEQLNEKQFSSIESIERILCSLPNHEIHFLLVKTKSSKERVLVLRLSRDSTKKSIFNDLFVTKIVTLILDAFIMEILFVHVRAFRS